MLPVIRPKAHESSGVAHLIPTAADQAAVAPYYDEVAAESGGYPVGN